MRGLHGGSIFKLPYEVMVNAMPSVTIRRYRACHSPSRVPLTTTHQCLTGIFCPRTCRFTTIMLATRQRAACGANPPRKEDECIVLESKPPRGFGKGWRRAFGLARAERSGVVAQVSAFAEQYELTGSQLALVWLMQLPGGVIPLVGTANPDHIAEAARAVGKKLDRDDWYELMVIARGRPMPWGQRPFAYFKER